MDYRKEDWERLKKQYDNGEVSLARVMASLCSRFTVTPVVVSEDTEVNEDEFDFIFGEPRKGTSVAYDPKDFVPVKMEAYSRVSFYSTNDESGTARVPIMVWV